MKLFNKAVAGMLMLVALQASAVQMDLLDVKFTDSLSGNVGHMTFELPQTITSFQKIGNLYLVDGSNYRGTGSTESILITDGGQIQPQDFSFDFSPNSFNGFLTASADGLSLKVNSGVYQGTATDFSLVFNVPGFTTYNDTATLTITTLPVPEPESYSLMMAGLMMIGAVVKKKTK